VLITNYDLTFVAWPTVSFKEATVQEIHPSWGVPVQVHDDSPLEPGLQLRIEPGGARLFFLSSGN
jgi:hypothetical protein